MTTWKSKLFGDNRMNFYGWIGAGLIIIGVSIWAVLKALDAGALESPTCMMLGAIYFVLLGHLGIALQNYSARVAKAIEAEDDRKREQKSAK